MRLQLQFLTGLFLLGLSLNGCAYQRSTPAPSLIAQLQLDKVAVLPFENYAATPNAGLILAELFRTELYASGLVGQIPTEDINKALAGKEGESLPPEAIGKTLGASWLVLGRVTEYAYKTGLGEDPVVGVSIRLVDSKTGTVAWSGARSTTGRYAWIKEDSLSRLAQDSCHRLASTMLTQKALVP